MADEPHRVVSEPVSVPVAMLPWPGETHRIGLIALASDHSSECELWSMAPRGEVEIFVNRIENANPTTVDNLRAMGPRLTEAAQRILPGSDLSAMVYSCTSGSIVIGPDVVAEKINRAKPGVPCTTPITAALAAFEALGVTRVAVLTPYLDEVNAPVFDYLQGHGIEVVRFKSFRMESDVDMAKIDPSVIAEAALETDVAGAQALFISCTALRTTTIIETLETRLGKPVVTSNQAMMWHALRLSGYTKAVRGFGALLACH